jgi:hypothetical protein
MNDETVFPLKKVYEYLEKEGKHSLISFIKEELPIPDKVTRRSSFRRGYVICLMNENNTLNDFLTNYWQNGFTPKGKANMVMCRNLYLKNSQKENIST